LPSPIALPPAPPKAPPAPPAPAASFKIDVDAPSWSYGTLYVACDQPLNGQAPWTADAFPLTPDPLIQNRYTGTISVISGTIPVTSGTVVNFKITRGSWNTVEKGPEGDEVPNRVAICNGGPTTVFAHVFHWADDQILPPKVSIRDLGFFTPRSLWGLRRQVCAHLPPAYDDPASQGKTYPVLYVLDGQAAFVASRSPSGKALLVDQALDGNVAAGHGEFIAVAIDSTFERVLEYTPSVDPVHGGGDLELFVTFLLDELKPEIDRVYRTKTDPASTGIMGTALGGLGAFRAAWKHPDRIGLVASLSPEMSWNLYETKTIVAQTATKPGLRIWLDTGTAEGSTPQAQQDQLSSVKDVNTSLAGIGFTTDLRYEEVQGGTADETSWGARLPQVFAFLFP
jgi:predicted alpha/beta superfamily hydrolase